MQQEQHAHGRVSVLLVVLVGEEHWGRTNSSTLRQMLTVTRGRFERLNLEPDFLFRREEAVSSYL